MIDITWKNTNKEFKKNDVEQIINIFINAIGDQLKKGCNVKIEGLGTFSSYIRQAYVGENISNGNIETIPQTTYISFKPSNKLKNKNISSDIQI